MTGGGLSLDHSRRISVWRRRRRRPFLFPVKALSRMFRGKYLAALARIHRRGQLQFTGQCGGLAESERWHSFLATLQHTPWVVYAKRPFGGPERVLKYLSRYTHRVAISNRRLLFVGDGIVRFVWKDYADHTTHKEMTLAATEFLRRFLLHVVPRGFMRIRHYGILANRQREQKLPRCRELLSAAALKASDAPSEACDTDSRTEALDDNDTERPLAPCPLCGAPMRIIEVLAPRPHDSS